MIFNARTMLFEQSTDLLVNTIRYDTGTELQELAHAITHGLVFLWGISTDRERKQYKEDCPGNLIKMIELAYSAKNKLENSENREKAQNDIMDILKSVKDKIDGIN